MGSAGCVDTRCSCYRCCYHRRQQRQQSSPGARSFLSLSSRLCCLLLAIIFVASLAGFSAALSSAALSMSGPSVVATLATLPEQVANFLRFRAADAPAESSRAVPVLSVAVTSSRLVDPGDGATFREYKIEVSHADVSWHVWRRFSEFVTLQQALRYPAHQMLATINTQ